MADDEAEHPKTTAEPRFAPDLAPEIPLSGTENQPATELEEAEAKSELEPEITEAQSAEVEPSTPVSHVQSEEPISVNAHDSAVTHAPAVTHVPADAADRIDQEEPEATRTLASSVPETALANAPEPPLASFGTAGEQTKPRSRFSALAATAIIGGILGFGGSFALRYFEDSR